MCHEGHIAQYLGGTGCWCTSAIRGRRRTTPSAPCVAGLDILAALCAPVYDWFTEGLDLRDLKDAKALLEELA